MSSFQSEIQAEFNCVSLVTTGTYPQPLVLCNSSQRPLGEHRVSEHGRCGGFKCNALSLVISSHDGLAASYVCSALLCLAGTSPSLLMPFNEKLRL